MHVSLKIYIFVNIDLKANTLSGVPKNSVINDGKRYKSLNLKSKNLKV